MMTTEQRIEAAGAAASAVIRRGDQYAYSEVGFAAMRAAFPELFDGTGWVAPMEPSLAMKSAGGSEHGYFYEDEAGKVYRAMRDAHLSTEAANAD